MSKSGILFRLRRNRTHLWGSSSIFGTYMSALRILKTRLREKLSSGLRVWAPAFQASGLGFDVSGTRSGLRHLRHQVWASTFQLLGLGFDVSSIKSRLQRFRRLVWASTFQALGLGFDIRPPLSHFLTLNLDLDLWPKVPPLTNSIFDQQNELQKQSFLIEFSS